MKQIYHQITWKVLLAVLVLLMMAGVGVATISSSSGFSAEFADNVLRPIFGEKGTLEIESVYFGIGEKIKAIKYSFIPPQDRIFGSETSTDGIEHNSDNLNLFSIPVIHKFALFPGEGVWQTVHSPLFPNDVVIAKTFVRPDPNRAYANVAVVQFNMKRLGIGTEAGVRYPGGTHGVTGPGKVPQRVLDTGSLVSVFNGGFQEKDGHYGMVVGNTVYVPLRTGLATFYMYPDGTFRLGDYLGLPDPKASSIRQNGPFLVQDGNITPFVEEGKDTWGRTTTNSMYTWRSGMGVTKDGNLLFAVGGSLVPDTLAQALKMAGAVNAMQLDINPFWVRLFFYQSQGNGQYSSSPLLPSMKVGAQDYLKGYEKDLFYIYKK